MQNIFYHNSSGHMAFTGPLKSREVHRTITLHPVKQYSHMYRVNNYVQVSIVCPFYSFALSNLQCRFN